MTGRFARENFNRAGYERALSEFCALLREPDASVPSTEAELTELGRLVAKYPEHARRLVASLPASSAAASPRRPA